QRRKRHREGRTPALAVARRPDGSAVQLDDMPHDRQSDAESSVAARAGAVRLPEAFEEMGQELGRDALAGIDHAEQDVAAHSAETYLASPPAGRERDRVTER